MADYTPPSKSNIPFNFSTGGYTPPDFSSISFKFSVKQIQSAMSNLKAAIQVFDTKKEAYTYLKYCERYIVGYGTSGVQIIQGRCYYGGIRDIGGFIRSATGAFSDLAAGIEGKIRGVDLPAYIGTHPYQHLQGSIRGFMVLGFPAFVRGMVYENLPSSLNIILPVDLLGYLRARLLKDLPAKIHGFEIRDLSASIDRRFKADLKGQIGSISTMFVLPALLKGWVRQAFFNLGGYVQGYAQVFLPGFIRGTEFRDLTASLIYIQPVDIKAGIHGWQTSDLSTLINGYDWPWNLPASIISSGGYSDLAALIFARAAVLNEAFLPARIVPMRFKFDIPAQVHGYAIKNLSAHIDTGKDIKDLQAKIYPKVVRLTAVLSVSTLRKSDLIGIINVSCRQSTLRDLPAEIDIVFKSDLNAFIRSLYSKSIFDLSAEVGRNTHYIAIDNLPLNVYVKKEGFRVEDKKLLYINASRSLSSLSAFIKGEPRSVNLPAVIVGQRIRAYEFDEWKKKERVYDLYQGEVRNYKDVEIDFEKVVSEYLYSSVGNVATRKELDEHWRTRLRSFYSPQDTERYLSRLYKVKILHDLKKFKTIDEAIRYGIDYVSGSFSSNLIAQINCVGATSTLGARILVRKPDTSTAMLGSFIRGVYVQEDDKVILSTTTGINIL